MSRSIVIVLSLVVSLSACSLRKTTRGKAGNIPGNDLKTVEKAVLENAYEFEYLSFKAAAHFQGMGMDQNISLSVRMKRHETVWISAQAMLGIEVARILVTKDSFYVIQNFPDRSYHEYSIDSISNLLSIPLTVTQLQDALIGNPLLPYEGAQVALQADSIVVEKTVQDFRLREFFHPAKARMAKTQLFDKKTGGEVEMRYSNFTPKDTKELPVKVNIFVQQPDLTAQIDLEYSSISLEPITNFPFRKPAN